MKNMIAAIAAVLAVMVSFAAQAQVPQYGPEVNLEQARAVIAAGQAEARKNNWPVAIAVVDNHGFLVALREVR